MQELLYQKVGYGVSLTEDYSRKQMHASLYQTHVRIQKVLSEGVKLNFDNAYLRIFMGERAGSKY